MIIGTPMVKARGLLAPTLCFCNELKAIMAIVIKEMAEKPSMAVKANVTKPWSAPVITIATTLAVNSAVKRVSEIKRADFK